MPNLPIATHPLIGTEHVFRADLPPYDAQTDREPGQLVVGPGHHVNVVAVFADWNGVAGLDMLAVLCRETGLTTHLVPADLGLPVLS
jgi:hypothetical protein